MYISHNEKQAPVGRQWSGGEPDGGGGGGAWESRKAEAERSSREVKKGGNEHER